jgi:hypothetical protein
MTTWKTRVGSEQWVLVESPDRPDKTTHVCRYQDNDGLTQEVPAEPWTWDDGTLFSGKGFDGLLELRPPAPTGARVELVPAVRPGRATTKTNEPSKMEKKAAQKKEKKTKKNKEKNKAGGSSSKRKVGK